MGSDRWDRGGRASVKVIVTLVICLIFLVGAGLVWKNRQSKPTGFQHSTRADVKQGDLVVTILQSGELEAKRSESIINETDREAKILYVVDDGARIKKGDLLVELESEDLKNKLLQSESDVSRAEADLKNAQEELEIQRLKHQTDLASARLRVEVAKLELKKYVEAEYPQSVDKAVLDITVAKEELARSKDKLEWTRKLVDKEYASRQELESGELEVQRKEIEVKNKEVDLQILKEYTHVKEQKQKENEVAEAQAEVDRLDKTYASERARNEANLQSKKTALEVQRRQLKKTQDQVEKTRIVSKWNGQVFYPKLRPWDNRKIEKGASVYPRQQLLQFPDLSAWKINVGVPESIIDKIKPGQKAVATIDALPDEILQAVVQRVGVVPDQSRWFDSSTKTYTVTLDIPTTPTVALKPGMSVAVEIVTGILKNVITVPIQAVVTDNDKHYVFLADGSDVKRIPVETGENNEESIQIVSGLEKGQQVLLYAPVEAEIRGGLKERPLDKAKKEGKDVDLTPSQPTEAEKSPDATKKGPARQQRDAGTVEKKPNRKEKRAAALKGKPDTTKTKAGSAASKSPSVNGGAANDGSASTKNDSSRKANQGTRSKTKEVSSQGTGSQAGTP